jgi:hypothetical protein
MTSIRFLVPVVTRRYLSSPVVTCLFAVVLAGQGQTPPPPTIPPPVIPPVVVPTNPPTISRPVVPKTAGPATRSTDSLIIGQIVDTSGRPVPRAIVRLMGDRPIETVVADARGRFFFRNVPLGEMIVTAEKIGYFNGGYGQRRASGLPLPFSMPYGQTIANMRIELYRGGVITGAVADEAGEPVAGARVVALRRQFVSGEWKYAAADATDTDDKGAYRLFGLQPGEYVVTVPSADTALPARSATPVVAPPDAASPPSVFPTMYYPSTSQRILSQPIALRSGDVRYAVDFTLPIVRTRRVTGRLSGDSIAVVNQRIRIVPIDAGWAAPDPVAEATSELDGSFRLERVPSGQYQLLAGNVDAAIRNTTAPPPASAAPVPPAPPTFCARVDVVVDDDDIDLGGISMRPTSTVTGEIRLERPPAGQNAPAPPGRVALTIEPGGSGLSRATTLYAGSDNQFTISNLIPGDYFIRADQLPRGWFVKSMTSGATDALDAPVTVRGDDVSLAVTLTTRGTEVIGTVRDARMQFAIGATVIIVPMLADGRAIWTPNRIRETRTSTSGVFNVKGLPPGDYLVVAIDDATAEGWQDPRRLAALRPLASRFRLRDAETVSLVLTIK